jgi:hypothetical protein
MRAARVDADALEAIEACYERGWSDGLPVVPPTPARVGAMLGGRDPEAVAGAIPPLGGVATLEKIAVNAVMAGCLPAYFPVVAASVRAACDPRFNLNGVQATTHVASPLILVSGPIVERIGMNASFNVFGPGNRANATIGRALRLICQNLGGARPGVSDMATFGHPGKYTYCIAERADVNPWAPFHAERGVPAEASAVTVFAGEAPRSIVASNYDRGILLTAADTMATLGAANLHLMGEMLYVVGREHARTLGEAGWTKAAVREFLFAHARRPVRDFKPLRTYGREVWERFWPAEISFDDDDARVPIAKRPDDILVTVSGGDVGRFSVCCPGWGDGGQSVTVAVED